MALSPTIILLIATIFLPAIAMAKEFVVGDNYGWTVGVNYDVWAADKTFQVGDTLVFKYPVGEHNVFKVNGSAFESCTVPPPSEALSTGNDRIVLTIPGRKWYICGVGGHCQAGQKLVITVQPQTMPPTLPPLPSFPPVPSPPSPSPSQLPLPPSPSPSPPSASPSPSQHRPHFGLWVPNKKMFTISH